MKGPLGPVVVGVDGSALSAAALDWVAHRLPAGAALHVVHAVAPATELAAAAFQVDWTADRRRAEADLAGPWTEVARAAGHEPVAHLVDDDPARALLGLADQVSATAVVIGVHGVAGHHLPYLGGVTRRILHRSPRPVIVVNVSPGGGGHGNGHGSSGGNGEGGTGGGTDGADIHVGGGQPVVVGVGWGEASDRAVRWAAHYAATTSRPLHLLHAVADRPLYPLESPVDTLGSYLGPGVDTGWAAEDLALVAEQVLDRYPELRVATTVERGSAGEALVAAGTGAELLVTGKRHGAMLARMTISPRLRHILAHAPCPVVVVPSSSPVPD